MNELRNREIALSTETAVKRRAIIGLGTSGLATARFLAARGWPFEVFDTRPQPPGLDQIKSLAPHLTPQLGEFTASQLCEFDQLIVSPGLDASTGPFKEARLRGIEVINEIELFSQFAQAPVVAVTGTNAKSTVTTMLAHLASATGVRVAAGGNLGPAALDLLDDDVELYVLELSSFQLETVVEFRARVAGFLNFSPDHLDRYSSIDAYKRAKMRVYAGASTVVFNRDDAATFPLTLSSVTRLSFGLGKPADNEFGLLVQDDVEYLALGERPLLAVNTLPVKGRHNIANALAALALGHAMDLDLGVMCEALKSYRGLPHRCVSLGDVNGVEYINDSKATNVGAAAAAIDGIVQGLPSGGRIVLIAGGIAKEDDFALLVNRMREHGRAAITLGVDGPKLGDSLAEVVRVEQTGGIEEAVSKAAEVAEVGDVVLLAPACASQDMFHDYADRGNRFASAVSALGASR